MKTSALFGLAASIFALAATGATGADWPTKPVRIVVPFAAGGAADVVSRLVADSLGTAFGQQFVVENRAGGGGIVAAQFVARSEPDGYTLMQVGMSSHVVSPAMSKNPGFDPVRDFRAMTPAELTRFVQSQVNQWAPIIKATIKAE